MNLAQKVCPSAITLNEKQNEINKKWQLLNSKIANDSTNDLLSLSFYFLQFIQAGGGSNNPVEIQMLISQIDSRPLHVRVIIANPWHRFLRS